MSAYLALFILLFSASSFSQSGYLADYDYQVTDIATKGLTKEVIYQRIMSERSFMKNLEDSICANRAHVWAYDLERYYGIKTGKMFLFFGNKVWKKAKKGWMYHVAPYIIENGKEYILEASYDDVNTPLTLEPWVKNEAYGKWLKGDECIEINSSDTDLSDYFWARVNLPENRGPGKQSARCYYRKTPSYYAYPPQIVERDTRLDENGRPSNYNPTSFNFNTVFSACRETAVKGLAFKLGGGKEVCEKHFGL